MAAQWWGLLAIMPFVAAVLIWQNRRRSDPPAITPQHVAPAQIDLVDLNDRALIATDSASWFVVLFGSATCAGCAQVWQAASVLESSSVAVCQLEYIEHRELHERYRITAVPTLVIVDATGVVRRSFMGSVTATHLWAAVAELREPGTVPPGCGDH